MKLAAPEDIVTAPELKLPLVSVTVPVGTGRLAAVAIVTVRFNAWFAAVVAGFGVNAKVGTACKNTLPAAVALV